MSSRRVWPAWSVLRQIARLLYSSAERHGERPTRADQCRTTCEADGLAGPPDMNAIARMHLQLPRLGSMDVEPGVSTWR